jgi:aspartate kinase
MRVLKFGGTSVADAAAIRRAVAIVASRQGPRTVVVSALAGATDALLATADVAVLDEGAAVRAVAALVERHAAVAAALQLPGPHPLLSPAIDGIARGAVSTVRAIAAAGTASPPLVDRLVACGELWSSRLVCAALTGAGVPALWVDARHVVRTDARHGCAQPDLTATGAAVSRLLRPALARDRVVVLGGFIGSGPDGETTTLGRGGSDYSAALVGACLLADEIEIWTDVDGVLTADPRVVPGARVVPSLSYEDAEILATFGAKVLHPKTMEPAAARDIPVRVLNARRPGGPGTRIDAAGGEDTRHAAVASRGGLCLVELIAVDRSGAGGFAARALQSLADADVRVFVGEIHPDRLTVAVDHGLDLEVLRSRVAAFAQVRARHGLAAVCAVGVVAAALTRFDEGPIHLVARPAGDTGFVVIVDDGDAHRIVARLHEALIAGAIDAEQEIAS